APSFFGPRCFRLARLRLRSTDERLVGEPLSGELRKQLLETSGVVGLARVEPEDLLVEIPEQVKRLDIDLGAVQAALQQPPEVLDSVGVNFSPHVLLEEVIHGLVIVLLLQAAIARVRVGGKLRARRNVLADMPPQPLAGHVRHNGRADSSATFQNPGDHCFAASALLSVPCPAARPSSPLVSVFSPASAAGSLRLACT